MEFSVSFGETPPGTLASALVTSAATVILIWIAGWLVSRDRNLAGSIPAITLAFPAIAASWFGFSSTNEQALGTSLLARACLIWSGALSFCAVALYLSNARARYAAMNGLALLGVTDLFWALLLILGSISTLYVGGVYFVRAMSYNVLLQRERTEPRHWST